MGAIACAWFRRNVFQPCDGGRPCTMYFETVDWATSKPSINSSPWIPRCSPPRVFLAHPSDQIAQLSIDLWPPCPLPRFPTPERRETRTMPAKDGLRLNDLRRSELIRHSCAGPSRTAESSTPDVVRPVVHRRHTRAQCFGEAEQDAAVAVTGVNSRPRRKLTGKYPTIFPCSCCSLLTVGTPRRSGRRHRYAPYLGRVAGIE